jgi:hypothetical protein
MSRLESMYRRIGAQISGLNWAVEMIADLPGDVLELGLGNGRSYHHLREKLPNRSIWVIDREMNAHPSSVPPDEYFLKGEAEAMLARMASGGVRLALAHYDFGVGVDEVDDAEALRLSPAIRSVMVPGGLIVSQQRLEGFSAETGPDDIARGRYFFYRA